MPWNRALRLSLALLVAAGVLPARAASSPAFAAGETAVLHGLAAAEGTTTNLVFVNRAAEPNRCELALADAGGGSLGPAITLTLRPHEERPFVDVFARPEGETRAAAEKGSEAEGRITCTGSFDAFALVGRTAGGELELVRPDRVEGAADSLSRIKAIDPCANGADCFDASGVVHVPESAKPVGRVTFPAAAGEIARFRTSLDVTVGQWYAKEPSGKHLIYWFVIDRNYYMPGLLYFRGPNKYEAFARHGMGLTHPQKIKVIKKWKAEVGRTYHVVNDYDMAGSRYTVTVSDAQTGQVLVTLQSRPNVGSFLVTAGAKYILDMGFPQDKVPTEVPSYGWKYSNVRVEAFKKR